MSFWGIEVKPGKPHPYHSDNVQGRLCITQATLGLGSSKERTVLQCSVGHKSPVFLCSLLPNKMESCSLNLEFKDELVAFSVIGPRSVHLCGYFASDDGDNLRDEYEYESDSGEDIAEIETSDDDSDDDSDEFDYGDEFINDDGDLGMFPPSPVPNSGVVIEEITDDGKAENGNGASEQMKKKKKTSDLKAQHISQRQIVAKSNAGASVFESEDEDGFPISSSHKSKATDQEPQAEAGGKKGKIDEEKKKKQQDDNNDAGKKRKMKNADQDSQLERKTKKKQKEKLEEANELSKDESQPEVEKKQDTPDENVDDQRGQDMDADSVPKETSSDKKKKKKKKTTQDVEGKSEDQANSAVEDKAKSSMEAGEKQSELGSSNVRTFSNGLVIEELAMGKPDGKKANPGSQVSVQYIGKLKKNGKIFDSCVGRAPFKFRLGVGSVIKGWDVGIAGMRIGDKRRLTIPPSMGYGDKGAGGVIPPNAWLVFDVELVNVR